ncbi:MAG: right-handed parallel beta-helix repeat-containing protein [bacterium]
MKKGWKTLTALFVFAVLVPTLYSLRSTGNEPGPLQTYASLGNLLAAPAAPTQQTYFNQFFTEENLTVTQEGDGFVPGTLRTILLQAAGIRHNNPFTLVKIGFDSGVKKVRLIKGNLPAVEDGLTTIDCGNRVIIDGSQIDPRYLQEGETANGLTFRSSGNALKGCQLIGFSGHALVLSGNRNQIKENKIGTEAAQKTNPASPPTPGAPDDVITNGGSGIYIADQASENVIESNSILGNKQDGITLSPQAGPGNRIVNNVFQDNGKKGINGNENANRTHKPAMKGMIKEGDTFIISGTVADTCDMEIYMASQSGREGKILIVPLFSTGRGDFSVSVKNKGFIPGESKIVVLATASGHNTSEFSDAVVVPSVDSHFEAYTPPSAPPSALTNTAGGNENKEAAHEGIVTIEENKNTDNGTKPLNEKASSALSVGTPPLPTTVSPSNTNSIFSTTPSSSTPSPQAPPPAIDPFLNATTLPPPSPTPPPSTVSPPPSVQNNPAKSGASDSVRVESVTEINGAP